MKLFAIGLHAGEPAQRNLVTNLFSSKGWGYWHWIDDFWIVQTPDGYTPKLLWSEIENLPGFGTPTILVIELQGSIDYWGRGDKAAWDWLNNFGIAR